MAVHHKEVLPSAPKIEQQQATYQVDWIRFEKYVGQ